MCVACLVNCLLNDCMVGLAGACVVCFNDMMNQNIDYIMCVFFILPIATVTQSGLDVLCICCLTKYCNNS